MLQFDKNPEMKAEYMDLPPNLVSEGQGDVNYAGASHIVGADNSVGVKGEGEGEGAHNTGVNAKQVRNGAAVDDTASGTDSPGLLAGCSRNDYV